MMACLLDAPARIETDPLQFIDVPVPDPQKGCAAVVAVVPSRGAACCAPTIVVSGACRYFVAACGR